MLRCQRSPTCSESVGLRPSLARTSSCSPSDELSLGKAAVGKADVEKAAVGKAAVGKADVGKAALGKAAEGAAASPSTTISADLTSSADHSTIAEIRVHCNRVQGLDVHTFIIHADH